MKNIFFFGYLLFKRLKLRKLSTKESSNEFLVYTVTKKNVFVKKENFGSTIAAFCAILRNIREKCFTIIFSLVLN